MSKKFLLPDLGEGLPDATIVEWYVKEGDTIRLDENLVSMETAKAVVDVPSPVSGKVLKLAGAAGDIIVTGTMLAEFEVDASLPQRAEGQDTGHHHGPVGGPSGPNAPAIAAEAAPTKALGAFRRRQTPPSGGRTESLRKGLSGMDAARDAMGQGWPFAAGPWSNDGVREPRRRRGRMSGWPSLWLLSLGPGGDPQARESDSP